MGSLEFFGDYKSTLISISTSLLCSAPPPTDGTDAGAVERLPGRLFPSRCRPRVAQSLLHRFLASRWPSTSRATRPEPPRGRHRDAAVASSPQSPSPRSRALQIAPQTIPFVCFPIPQPQTQEHHRRRPPNAGELDAAVGPPLCGSSARADHTSSFALVPRSSTTPPTRSIPTGTAPPPTRAPTSSKLAAEPPR